MYICNLIKSRINLNLNKIYRKKEDTVTRQIAGETLLVPIRSQVADMRNIFALTHHSAEYIWRQLDGKQNLEQMHQGILDNLREQLSSIDAVLEEDNLSYQEKAINLRNQYDRQRANMATEVAKVENDLRNADQDLGRQRTVLAPDAFANRQQALQKRFADAQQDVQNRRRDLEQAFANANNKVINEMLVVVREVAAENEFKVVFAKSQIVTLDQSLEITGEVLTRVNQRVPSVQLQAAQN